MLFTGSESVPCFVSPKQQSPLDCLCVILTSLVPCKCRKKFWVKKNLLVEKQASYLFWSVAITNCTSSSHRELPKGVVGGLCNGCPGVGLRGLWAFLFWFCKLRPGSFVGWECVLDFPPISVLLIRFASGRPHDKGVEEKLRVEVRIVIS